MCPKASHLKAIAVALLLLMGLVGDVAAQPLPLPPISQTPGLLPPISPLPQPPQPAPSPVTPGLYPPHPGPYPPRPWNPGWGWVLPIYADPVVPNWSARQVAQPSTTIDEIPVMPARVIRKQGR